MTGQLGLFGAHTPSLDGVDRIRLAASYSADCIGMGGTVRKPHAHDGGLWVYTGNGHGGSDVYQLVPLAEFDGVATTYGARTDHPAAAEAARNDPMGFYHGMTVKHGGVAYVLCGPCITLDGSISAEAWAEERTRIGNTPSEDDEDEDAGEDDLFDDFDDDGRTAIGNGYEDDDDGEDAEESENAA